MAEIERSVPSTRPASRIAVPTVPIDRGRYGRQRPERRPPSLARFRAREILHHFENEEVNILPAFAQQKPIEARAVAEHEQIRATLAGLGVDLALRRLSTERVADFVDSLRAHTRREDDLLYPWAAHEIGNAAADSVRERLSKSADARRPNSEEWRIDLERSTLSFSLRHIVVHEIRGQFRRWDGTITLDDDLPARSSVRLWVDLASVDTDDSGRDDQIRSAEFFDVAIFPQATFSSTGVQLTEHANPIVRDISTCMDSWRTSTSR